MKFVLIHGFGKLTLFESPCSGVYPQYVHIRTPYDDSHSTAHWGDDDGPRLTFFIHWYAHIPSDKLSFDRAFPLFDSGS